MHRSGIMMAFAIVLCFFFSQGALAEEKINVYLEGKQLHFDVDPFNDEGTVMVPFRPIFEAVGLEVTWNDATKKIIGSNSNKNWKIELTIGSQYAKVNDETVVLAKTPSLVNGATMVPLRFVGESSGKKVSWDDQTQTVLLTKGLDLKRSYNQYGGDSFDPENHSLKFGTPKPMISIKDGFTYVVWDRVKYVGSKTYKYLYVSIAKNDQWIVQAHSPIYFDLSIDKNVQYILEGNSLYLRTSGGIEEHEIDVSGKLAKKTDVATWVWSSQGEIFRLIHSVNGKRGFILGPPDRLKIYFDKDTDPIEVKDLHGALLNAYGVFKYMYNPDRNLMYIFAANGMKQLNVTTGDLVYDQQGKDLVIPPVSGYFNLVAGPAYYEGKIYYAYVNSGSKRVKIATFDQDLKQEENIVTNYFLDVSLKSPMLSLDAGLFYLWGVGDFNRRPSIQNIQIERY